LINTIISVENIHNNIIEITDKKDINHLKNVFRINIGDEIRASDGEKIYISKVLFIDKNNIKMQIDKICCDAYSSKIRLDMGISLIKNDKMDMVIQKLTELGVDSIIPIITERVIINLKEKEEKKLEKWNLISRETLKQCQGIKKVNICNLQKLQDIDFDNYELIIVPYECENENTIKNLLSNISKIPENILVIIGPEGGFAPKEITFLVNKGAKIVTLGKRILRAETASIVVGGILLNEFM
jgi:16S rRNA (uracil1498-N3)-methyltransferase